MIDNDFIKEHTLMECLKVFKGAQSHNGKSRLECVTEEFEILAKKFLYGGYIKVGDDYDIYINNVEFYYHEEDDKHNPNPDRITDPKVYHCNDQFPGRFLPPFPIMTLHSHWSGFDITFEDPEGKYRASVLIREYSVFDHKTKNECHPQGGYVDWNTKAIDKNDNKKGSFSVQDIQVNDTRSSYLQYYLNGFSMDGGNNRIEWIDEAKDGYGPVKALLRKNIDQKRLWAFKRMK